MRGIDLCLVEYIGYVCNLPVILPCIVIADLGLRLRVWMPSFFMLCGRFTCSLDAEKMVMWLLTNGIYILMILKVYVPYAICNIIRMHCKPAHPGCFDAKALSLLSDNSHK